MMYVKSVYNKETFHITLFIKIPSKQWILLIHFSLYILH